MVLSNPIRYHVYTGQSLPEARPYDYVLAQNGVFKRTSTRYFMASFCVAAAQPIAGLLPQEEYLKLYVPRIPARRWLARVLEHAQHAVDRRGPVGLVAEAMYHFHYFPGGRGWRVAVPQQQGTVGRVHYRGGDEPTVVLDLHSHHEVGAFFSAIDDRDEQGCRFYAVIGHIYTRPEIKLRLGVYGDFVDLPARTLFDGLGPFVEVE